MWLQSGNTGNNSTQRYQINDLSIESLTREIAIVAAQSHLFAGTLRDNLLMAKPNATENELWQALEAAHISDFVRAQSQELDLAIEQGASNLSGGQKQRIAIARALLRESAVYIFDEATSSVDVESETLILQTIRALADRGKTVIMVTHRMANAADADHVVVFERGRATEQDAHAELMRANGTYAKLFRAQQTVENIGLRNNATHSTSASHALKASDSAQSVTQRAEMGLKCPILQKRTTNSLKTPLSCPILPNRSRSVPKLRLECPILQKRTHRVRKRAFGCPIRQNRTRRQCPRLALLRAC